VGEGRPQAVTAISQAYPDRVEVRGRDLAGDLMGRVGFTESLADHDAVVTALLDLPPGQRRVVVLRYLCGLSVQETALELGRSEGTVKSQTSDALAKLAVTLAPLADRTEP